MRRLVWLVVVVVACLWVYRNRERLFVRDPLGSVTRNGVKERGAQVYINYSNDVLLENDNDPMYLHLLERGQPVSAPTSMKCIHYLVCLMAGYPEPQTFALPGTRLESMSDREVVYRDLQGRQADVRLR
jgi:hypothetical protein